VLLTVAEAIRVVAIILSPDLPRKSLEMLRALGFEKPENELTREGLLGWDRCPGPFHLDGSVFPRIEKDKPAPKKDAKGKSADGGDGLISIDQFFQSQLRTASVVAAESVEGANRLLKLQIKIGEEERQIVAGIAEHYEPEDLIGKTIVVVANLQPAKIRGIESNGMLLAASKGKTLRLIGPDGPIDTGAKVG
jgi:methionyl-tRNA synthetase